MDFPRIRQNALLCRTQIMEYGSNSSYRTVGICFLMIKNKFWALENTRMPPNKSSKNSNFWDFDEIRMWPYIGRSMGICYLSVGLGVVEGPGSSRETPACIFHRYSSLRMLRNRSRVVETTLEYEIIDFHLISPKLIHFWERLRSTIRSPTVDEDGNLRMCTSRGGWTLSWARLDGTEII